ncbi:MAG: DUF721 domain-containing protein [Desulfomonilaceae bacterium]
MKRKGLTRPAAAGSVLLNTLRRMGLGSALSRQSIVTRWPRIVDSVIAKHARAERLVGDTLHVYVDSSVWMNELAAVKLVLLEKINSKIDPEAPKIKDIRFSQTTWRRGEFAKENTRPGPPSIEMAPDTTAIEVSISNINSIKNTEIRRIVERIIRKDARFKANHPRAT